ncbi:MAG: hypothetical protein LBB11_01135 [Puniceicoccales bacterium]|jgi:hypothetical protein|nr:hypothetical protein [Puniceicoccales bacterium]
MSEKIEWCIAQLKDDYKWWLEKVGGDININVNADETGIIDPHQFEHIIELASSLIEYGLRNEIIENAFLKFRILSELPNNQVKLELTTTKIFPAEEPLFLLPNIVADNEGPYAEFIDHIVRMRVKLLNDLLDFKVPMNTEELEESIYEKYHEKYIEGSNIHVFDEIADILEYIPAGYDINKKGEFDEETEPNEEPYNAEEEAFEADKIEWDDEELQKLEIVDR